MFPPVYKIYAILRFKEGPQVFAHYFQAPYIRSCEVKAQRTSTTVSWQFRSKAKLTDTYPFRLDPFERDVFGFIVGLGIINMSKVWGCKAL